MTTDTGERAHVDRAGVVAVALPFAKAMALFTPEGERPWAVGWDPQYLHPASPDAGEGVVFQTTNKGESTATWVQTRYEPTEGLASYVYVIPDHHTAMVDVRVSADGEDRSRASVRYRMTSLSPDADESVLDFGAAYDKEMSYWAEAIQRHVVEGVPIVEE